MPVYEDKLVCPLAVRFTEDHIRPKFKDGRELEESIHQIQVKPGFHGYDFLLEALFPSIEIIRWSQFDTESAESEADHWFTLDNRRLYCLQRVAASLWPRKCAIHVEVLYAAGHGIKRKDTSSSVGRSVEVRHSSNRADTLSDRWEWRAAVQVGLETRLRRALCGITEEDVSRAHEFVACEDEKASTEELLDAPEVPRLLSHTNMDCAFSEGDVSTDVDSASAEGHASTAPSPQMTLNEEEAMLCKEHPNHDSDILSALQLSLTGTWTGNLAETYQVMESGKEATWTCVRRNTNGSSKKYTLWYDDESNSISWGLDWSYYADASEFLQDPANLQWYKGWAKEQAPAFRWHCATHRASSTELNRSSAEKTASTERTEGCWNWYPSKRSGWTNQSKAHTKEQCKRWTWTCK